MRRRWIKNCRDIQAAKESLYWKLAFNITMKQFVDQEKKDNEEKRDNSNGNY